MKEKGRFLKKHRGNICLNCEVPLEKIDRYCHQCGQVNTIKKPSLKDFFDEYFSSAFSYDSRLRHTIVSILFKPGKISKEYIEGKRIKYANPFRFYLSVSIIFFILNSFFINTTKITNNFNRKETEKTVINYSETQLEAMNRPTAFWNRLDMYAAYYLKTKEMTPDVALDSLVHKKTNYTKYLYKRATKISDLKEANGATPLLKFIFDKLPLIIFFFLPIFALAIRILYIRKPFNYMEHLIFTFHTQTMFFVLLGISILIGTMTNSEIPSKIAILLFLFYLYKAMRRFYEQSRGKTIVKFLLVNVLFFILATIGALLTFMSSIFLY